MDANQIRAARGLLNWHQKDLARCTAITAVSVANIETEKSAPNSQTQKKIIKAFERAGVFFTSNGVYKEDRYLTSFEGEDKLSQLLDDVSFVLDGQGELLIDGADDHKTPDVLVAKVRELRRSGIRMRHLICDQDRYLRAPVEEYRWVPKRTFVNQVMFTYGNTLAIAIEDEPTVLIHRNKHLAAYSRERFNLLWQLLQQPDESHADECYE